jgi:hypothetical protein
VYGNTRFLTQLRTGFTITACGQTRMVNSIQSDVELTIDRPFTLGNREFLPAPSSEAAADDLYVRGLTRLMPLWPRGVGSIDRTISAELRSGAEAPVCSHSCIFIDTWWTRAERRLDVAEIADNVLQYNPCSVNCFV